MTSDCCSSQQPELYLNACSYVLGYSYRKELHPLLFYANSKAKATGKSDSNNKDNIFSVQDSVTTSFCLQQSVPSSGLLIKRRNLGTATNGTALNVKGTPSALHLNFDSIGRKLATCSECYLVNGQFCGPVLRTNYFAAYSSVVFLLRI